MNFLKTYIHIVISGSKAHKTKNNTRIYTENTTTEQNKARNDS